VFINDPQAKRLLCFETQFGKMTGQFFLEADGLAFIFFCVAFPWDLETRTQFFQPVVNPSVRQAHVVFISQPLPNLFDPFPSSVFEPLK
jgi:hypothetical protein